MLPATIVPNALFYRNKEFKFIALRSFVIQIATGTAAVVAALCGAGLYALIIGPILSGILIFAVSIRHYPQRLKFTLGLDVLRRIFSLLRLPVPVQHHQLLQPESGQTANRQIHGHVSLGLLRKVVPPDDAPLQNITQVITPVMHPIFSDYQDDLERLASGYERIVRFLAFIGLPLSVLLYFTAGEVTLIIFGDQWTPSIRYSEYSPCR